MALPKGSTKSKKRTVKKEAPKRARKDEEDEEDLEDEDEDEVIEDDDEDEEDDEDDEPKAKAKSKKSSKSKSKPSRNGSKKRKGPITFADAEEMDGGDGDDFEPLNGTYEAEVEAAEWDVAGENAKFPGSDIIKWTFLITGPDEDDEGRKAWSTSSTASAKALGVLRNYLIAMGAERDELDDADYDLRETLDDFVGASCRLVIRKKKQKAEYGGGWRHEVKRVLPFDEDDDE